MIIVGKLKLKDFWHTHPEARNPLERWIRVVESAKWGKWTDLKSTFNTASLVGKRVVFNVGGNKYRLITIVNYRGYLVIIEAALTHHEYDEEKWKR